ncbi:hypothetical protein CPB85DRAFT_445804 [Mucidula mucida]|nr:hypothetical protein CPB85DRAFT_445804 [Mucidula mucida]
MGEPQLMMSFTSSNQCGAVKNQWAERDSRFGVDGQRKADKRADIPDPRFMKVRMYMSLFTKADWESRRR